MSNAKKMFGAFSKKLEQYTTASTISPSEHSSFKISIEQVYQILLMFPQIAKTVIAKSVSAKKDQFATALERLILHFTTRSSNFQIAHILARLYSSLYRCRDKPRTQFSQWISKIQYNTMLYLSALSPKSFDHPDLKASLPADQSFYFLFEEATTLKEVKDSYQVAC